MAEREASDYPTTTDSSVPQPGTEVAQTNHTSQVNSHDGATAHQKHHHHHLPRMLLHRKKSSKRRVALPVTGSSATITPDGAHSEEVRNENLPTDEGPKSQATFMRQVLDWVKDERQRQRDRATKKEARKAEKKGRRSSRQEQKLHQGTQPIEATGIPIPGHEIRDGGENLAPKSPTCSESQESTSSTAGASRDSLDRLEQIARAGLAVSSTSLRLAGSATGTPRGPSRQPSKKALRPRSHPTTSYTSDTDFAPEGDVLVPECEESLAPPEKIGWDRFKEEVLKLTHTLRCKGWRKIALERYKELEIKRMSGALTNAVYMVSPPPIKDTDDIPPSSLTRTTRKPAKLLLRLYGAQVSHLINRETELSILRRLARKKIGPRLLGTFENGRFEEFFHAETLTKDDLRNPETSKQIAKRMRELHENITLEEEEVKTGPIVWAMWDKWAARARDIMELVEGQDARGGVLVAWNVFEDAVGRYRKWLVARYGGEEEMRRKLVFAHNDTQYGNILRMIPTGDSPLLLPMNTHRQLIVIDFEYASPNLPGFEIANHFCEWMTDYHSPNAPHVLSESRFPTLEEQKNFVKAYIGHSIPHTHGRHPHQTPCSTPYTASPTPVSPDARTPTTTPGQFMLDVRTPVAGTSASSYKEEEAARQEEFENEIERLREEARAWRPASHAMWAAWGVVQAKLPSGGGKEGEGHKDERGGRAGEGEDGDEEFSYLGYAQQRALLFWGDILGLGLMTEDEVRACFVGGGSDKIKRIEQ